MLRFLTAGESHGQCLTAIIDGMPSNLIIDEKLINEQLARRQVGYGRNKRMQIEHDEVKVLSGVIHGKTIGSPISIQVINRDWENWKDKWAEGTLPKLRIPRPGHADYSGMKKYNIDDARLILERASARETTARVAVGSFARILLHQFGIKIGSYVTAIGKVQAQTPDLSYEELWKIADKSNVRCVDHTHESLIKKEIDQAWENGETLGGIFEVAAINVPIGFGSHVHWDRRLDTKISAAMMSIPAIKGVEIGSGFENASLPGSEVHDTLSVDKNDQIKQVTNRAGGVEGGISNGAPIVVRAAMKPIATTGKPLDSVDLDNGQPAKPIYQRSDVCAVPSAAVVGEAMLCWVLADALIEKFGGDSIEEILR